MAHARVVHCKRARYDVYIGRPSKWGNPFKVGRDGTREQVIERYERWLHTQPQLLADVRELAGKTLGCWCAPRACHGEVLARLADDRERSDSESVEEDDALCACAHRRSSHAPPASGDTRCLLVEDRRDLLAVFDDGRDGELGYCACLHYRPG